MKKSILVLALSLTLLVFSGSEVLAQTSKEISEPGISTWYSTAKVLPLGEDRNFITYEAFGVFMNDEGKGLFHEATSRTFGSYLMEKGISKDSVTYGYFVLKNGDKVFITIATERKTGAPTKGKATIIGGTGKCVNMQGGFEYTGFNLRPAAEGIFQNYNKQTIKYTLP